MRKSLFEYAEEHPKTAPPEEQLTESKPIQERWDELEKAKALKEQITRQLERGDKPQLILYTALSCIGLLSEDEAWETEAQSYLNHVYADIVQLSMDLDEAELERKRLEEMQEEYNRKLRKDIKRRLNGLVAIEQQLEHLLTDIDYKLAADPGKIGSEEYNRYWGLQ